MTLDEVLKLPTNPDEDHLRSIGLLPPPPAPAPPSVMGTLPASAAPAPGPVAKMTPPVHPEMPVHPGTAAPAAPEVPSMTAPTNGDLGIKPMELPKLDFKERQALPSTSPGVLPGSPGFYEGKIARAEDQKANPWGSPENHPGFGGKLAHVLGLIGNIAGNATIPGTMAMIPGTQLNRGLQENAAEGKLAVAKKEEAAESEAKARQDEATAREKSEKPLREAQTGEAKARGAEAQAQADALNRGKGKINPQYDKAGNLIGFIDKDGDLLGPKSPKLSQDMKDMMDAAEQKAAKPSASEEDSKYEGIIQKQKLRQPVTPEETAWASAYEKRKTLVPATNFTLNQPNKEQARSDKSFQYNNTQLDKVATPLDQMVARLGRLNDTLNQKSPQADALVAPELLSVMAGGPGSGVRMNEAEIARIVGGRSHWEALKAAAQKWSTDPDAARSITPDQDKQIRDLVAAVHDKVVRKQAILDEGRTALLDSEDPKEHRKTVAETKAKLDAIDAGEQHAETAKPAAGAPEGKVSVYDPQGNEHFVLKEKKDAFLKDPKYKGWSASAPTKQ